MKKIQLMIELKSPVVLTAMSNSTVMTASHDYFSGSVIRGLMARKYIDAKGYGKEADEHEDFLRLFFGSLRFLPAYPLVNKERSYPLPLSLMKSKLSGKICDLLTGEKPQAGYKAYRGFGVVDNGKLKTAEVGKVIGLHMSRSDVAARQSGNTAKIGAERLAGKSSEGGIYNYEAISAGQTFCACIIGSAEELAELVAVTGTAFSVTAGRSRLAQYGQCRITLGEITEMNEEKASVPDKEIYLRAETPLLPTDGIMDNIEVLLEKEVVARLDEGFRLMKGERKLYGSSEEIENFVAIWGMKRPRQTALAGGSVFGLTKNGDLNENDIAKINEIIETGCGARREEGFGQLRLWRPQESLQEITTEQDNSYFDFTDKLKTQKASDIAIHIVNRRILERVRNLAADDVAGNTEGLIKERTHILAKLDTILDAHPTREEFAREIERLLKNENGKTPQKPITKHLSSIKISGRMLKVLIKKPVAELPGAEQIEQFWNKDEKFAKLSKLLINGDNRIDLAGDEAFITYWHWFFRYARKKCQQSKAEGGAAE